jgi:protein-disulfide isomerase
VLYSFLFIKKGVVKIMKEKNKNLGLKNNIWMYGFFLLTIVVLVMLFATNTTRLKQNNIPSNENNVEENKYFLGDASAPVKMIEYSSVTCPFCKKYKLDELTFKNIKSEYIYTGKVLYEYKHFTRNQTDVLAANAAECAGEQNQFFEYLDLLYTNQTSLQNLEFEKYAEQLNLNLDEFNTCYQEQRYNDKIENDKQEAIKNGITGTPGFLINGEKVSGAQPFEIFKNVIDSKL